MPFSTDAARWLTELHARFVEPLPEEIRHGLRFVPDIIVVLLFLWLLGRIRRRIRRAALSETEEHDILDLWRHRFVTPRATGQTITNIAAEVRNNTRKSLHVVIHPGTYFVSSGHYQNMATTTTHRFTLAPRATEHIGVPAACINAGLPIPGNKDRFHGVARVHSDVSSFLVAARFESPMVIQAGVWALTDGFSAGEIQGRLISRSSHGVQMPAISSADVHRARCILDSLGIRHRI